MTNRLVVIGGDAGGMGVAASVRRACPDDEIIVLVKGHRTSYSACGIPYFVAREVTDIDDLVARTPEEFRDHGIDVRLGTEAVAIDLAAGTVDARDLATNKTATLGFDRLMIGTGATPTVPDWPGVDLPHVSVAHTLPDASRLDELAARCDGQPVVVIGGSYIGLEMAEAFLARGAHVSLLDNASQLMRNLDRGMADRVAVAARDYGIDVHLGVNVESITEKAVIAAEMELPAAVVVLALGVTPNTELALQAGLATGIRDAIAVDDHQRTSAEGVYAAGDCCESWHRISERPTWIALGTVANKAARVAGVNLAGGDARYRGVLGTAITKLCDTEISRTGLSVTEANDAGFDPVETTIEAKTRAGYYPGAADMAVQLVHEKGTGRLLGGQIVGGAGAAKRIDTIATALWGGLTVEEMVDLDLAYAPPFSPSWDPVNTAARVAAD